MSDKIIFKKGDYGFDVTFTIWETKTAKKDVTSLAVNWQLKNPVTGITKEISGSVVNPGTNGVVKFPVQQNFFDTVIVYDSEIEMVGGAYTENTDTFRVEVVADIDV